jgi:hypothetical protein
LIIQVYFFFASLVMILPFTLFLYLAVDAPTQTIIRVVFGKGTLHIVNMVINELLIYFILARGVRRDKILPVIKEQPSIQIDDKEQSENK